MSRDHLSTDLLLRRLDRELSAAEQAAVELHLAACAGCRAELDTLRAISGGIDQYSADLLEPTPAGQRRLLLAALEGNARKANPGPRKVLAALAMAASVILAVGISFTSHRPVHPPVVAPHAADNFIALPDANDSLSMEGTVVMQVDVPRDAVSLSGIPVSDGSGGGLVKAEVVVGADGLARAIRFLN
jgi:anti-sigma factor ChrR (cupin superfamily)